MRLPSLISRFDRNAQSRDPFVSQKWCRLSSRNPRDNAHPIATSIASVGRVKRLPKIDDQMQRELERDRPFARMVARVGKLDVECHAGLLLSLPPPSAPVVVHNQVNQKNVSHARGLASFSSTR